MGRPPAYTRIGHKRVHNVRTRGGRTKYRALRLDTGNWAWGSESITRKGRVINVVYNASNNELVRTNTLVKGAIVQIDAHPFADWYRSYYGVELGRHKVVGGVKKSGHVTAKKAAHAKEQIIDPSVSDQFNQGRLYARISSRPGQSGRCDGYILEGEELAFYQRKLK